ncbi:hypothetical protein COT72_04660 [archaeon CG10_big_fil_rev_8_21_14_0_10_43_11]|nr:MAG: hypothetical protein COT72_04660 [archaeon CG10_big_fil_rev_8_21_14_0_10_43_11]
MDLKLKDELTKALIETPGLSISELAKKTGNYYSYTHKVITEMSAKGLISIKKRDKNGKDVTVCYVNDAYKKEWVGRVRTFLRAILKDGEIKAAFFIMYAFIMLNIAKDYLLQQAPHGTALFSRATAESADSALQTIAATSTPVFSSISIAVIILLSASALLVVWLYRTRRS